MALRTKKGLNLPEGAVMVSKSDALKHQKALVRDWPFELDVLFLKYGRHIAAVSTLVSSTLTLNYFNRVFAPRGTLYILTFFPTVIMPTAFSYVITEKTVTNHVLLMEIKCPLCYQLKFAVSQFYLGMLFPAIYGYFTFASQTTAVHVPNINIHAREFWKTTYQIFKKGSNRFQLVGFIQTVLILFLPYMQSKELLNVMNRSESIYSEELHEEI